MRGAGSGPGWRWPPAHRPGVCPVLDRATDLEAELRYYRWNTWRIVAGTERVVPVFKEAGATVRDMREHPLHCIGYNIKAVPSGNAKPYKAYVETTREFLNLCEPRWLGHAVNWSAEFLTEDFS